MSTKRVITFDPAKDAANRAKHAVSLSLCDAVLAGSVHTEEDTRYDYGERRFVTFGYVNDRLHVAVWTPDPDQDAVRSISVRKANKREQKAYG